MKKGLKRFRLASQLLALVLLNGYVKGWIRRPHLYSGNAKGIVLPVLNCYACPGAYTSCPAGSLQHFMVVKAFPCYVLGVFFVFGAFLGRLLCGWACPFGLLQDILFKIKTKKLALPRWMRYGKYAFLVLAVFVLPYLLADTVFCKICPQGALEGGIPQVLLKPELRRLVGTLYLSKIAVLVVFVVAMVFVKRPFCRVVCPVGAALAVFNKVSLLRLRVDETRCDRCGFCRVVCPVDIAVYEDPNSLECVRCGECTACPRGAVAFTTLFAADETSHTKADEAGG